MHADEPTVLLVEDDLLSAMAMSEALRGKGVHVIEAANAEEAVAIVTAGAAIDIVLTEVRFPKGQDGLAFTRWFHRRHPKTKVFVTCGLITGREAVDQCRAEKFIPKPYDVLKLASELGALAKDERARRAAVE